MKLEHDTTRRMIFAHCAKMGLRRRTRVQWQWDRTLRDIRNLPERAR